MTESARDVMLHAWERHLTSVLDGEVVPGNAVDAMLTALRSAGYDPETRYEHTGWLHPKMGNFWEAKEHENRVALESAGWVPVFRRGKASE